VEARTHEKLNAVYETAMNAIAYAFLIVDRGRSIVFHNKAAVTAEARLAVALCNGKSVNAFALEAEVSVHTVRAQLSAILHKTGTHRQADLVRLLDAAPRLIDKA
jgi:DNA-binding NarL/FixJ family response regulator